MKYFIDTEFIENGITIDLISVGIVCEDNREYYAINEECYFANANSWVRDNVLEPIGICVEDDGVERTEFHFDDRAIEKMKPKRFIVNEILHFIIEPEFFRPSCDLTYDYLINYKFENKMNRPEFWAYYADYDWVVFCQLFGTMMDLPKSYPKYCRDLKQECDRLGNPPLPPQINGEHNALEDAKWNKTVFEFLQKLKVERKCGRRSH